MEYIYKFIEYINESNLLSIGLMVWIIFYLVYLYVKKYEEDEEYLGLKLIGFYLVGAFTFNFNFINSYMIIPVGFIVYLGFMKDKERKNNSIKKKAVNMGLIIVSVSCLNAMIYNTVEYRNREIPIKSVSITSLRDDYETIKKELGIEHSAGVELLHIEYYKNTKVRNLSYTIKDFSNNKVHYVSGNNKGYTIDTNKIYEDSENIFMFSSTGHSYNMDIETLLDMISNVKFKENKNASYYIVKYGNEEDYYEPEENLYTVNWDNYKIKKLNSKYPVCDAIDISHTPMRQVSEGSWSSEESDIYLMSYELEEDIEE